MNMYQDRLNVLDAVDKGPYLNKLYRTISWPSCTLPANLVPRWVSKTGNIRSVELYFKDNNKSLRDNIRQNLEIMKNKIGCNLVVEQTLGGKAWKLVVHIDEGHNNAVNEARATIMALMDVATYIEEQYYL